MLLRNKYNPVPESTMQPASDDRIDLTVYETIIIIIMSLYIFIIIFDLALLRALNDVGIDQNYVP